MLLAGYGEAVAAGLVAPGWTIHGFWPSRAGPGATGPTFCAAGQADGADSLGSFPPLPAALLPALNYHWPDISRGRPIVASGGKDAREQRLWQHEWQKHGSCYAGSRAGSSAYFLDALVAASRSNLAHALAAAGIVPSATQPYQGEFQAGSSNC